MRIVLIHGAATTSRIWAQVMAALPELEVVAPDRPSSGVLEDELDFLAGHCAGAVVGGVSGGATLGLALASRGVPFHAAVLHEPAAGSLAPGLLDSVAAAYATGGVTGFGTTLYGPLWSPADAPADAEAVHRDLTMFRGYEPAAPANGAGPVLQTVGARSPAIRHRVATALTAELGIPGRVIDGVGHAVHLEGPQAFAALLAAAADR